MAKLTRKQKMLLEQLEAGKIVPSQLSPEDQPILFQAFQERMLEKSKSSEKIINNVRGEAASLRIKAEKLEKLDKVHVKAETNNKSLLINFIDNLRRLGIAKLEICNDSIIPNIETADAVELEIYLKQVVATLATAIQQQTRYIDYQILRQTSEKNPSGAPNIDLNNYTNAEGVIENDSDANDAEVYGKEQEQYDTTATASVPLEFESPDEEDLSYEPKVTGKA